MSSEFIIPLIFWGAIIIFGIISYQAYKKKNTRRKYFEFHSWKKIIYWLGWINILNIVFWAVIAIYYRRYKKSPETERQQKIAYVIYYFGYITIIGVILFLISQYLF